VNGAATGASDIRVGLLGTVMPARDGSPVVVRGRKPIALLARLALDPRAVVPMTGLDVAARLIDAVPDRRIILFTAYVDDEPAVRAEAFGISDVVSKDHVAELAAILRRVRDGEAEGAS